jgi:hypothetical protein
MQPDNLKGLGERWSQFASIRTHVRLTFTCDLALLPAPSRAYNVMSKISQLFPFANLLLFIQIITSLNCTLAIRQHVHFKGSEAHCRRALTYHTSK